MVNKQRMETTPTLIPLYSDEKTLLEREVEGEEGVWKRSETSSVLFYFELERTVEWIKQGGYKRVRRVSYQTE